MLWRTLSKAFTADPAGWFHPKKHLSKSARRRGCGQGIRFAHSPTGEQNQKKRTYDVLPKPDKWIRYRQASVLRTRSVPNV
jgi:hypothetical protein